MNNIGVEQVLSQMRTLAAQAQGQKQAQNVSEASGVEFSNLLKTSINAVNDVQKTSGDLKTRFEMGDSSVNMVDIAIASEKSKIAFTAMTQVRNKLVQAYQDVMNMPV